MTKSAQHAATVEEFRILEQARSKAIVDVDLPALERMLTDDLSYTHSSGVTDDKVAFLARVQSRLYRRIAARDLTVRVQGGIAIVSGIADIDTEANGKGKSLVVRFVNVWLLAESGWRHALWQATIIPAPGAA